MIDRRRDPKADTGMFDCVYRQNLPRAPAYLGMSLSVRGRKLFKAKKNKQKPDETKKSKKEKHEPMKNSDILPKYVQTMLNPNVYTGPIIHDFIEELQTYYDSSDNGVDFVPAIHPPTKKKHIGAKNERVQKRTSINKNSIIKSNKNFINRNASENENRLTTPTIPRNRLIKSNYLRLFNEWSAKTNEEKGETRNSTCWERDTCSILKGKTIVTKLNIDSIENNINKSGNTSRCSSSLSLSTILPSLNNNNNNSAIANNNFLTVGCSFKGTKSALTNELILPNTCQS